MTIRELEELKARMTREAIKWVSYLDGLPDVTDRENQLARKLVETYLEGMLGR